MPSIPIHDLDDPRLEPYRNLKATNATRDRNLLIAEGDKLAHRLIDSRLPVESLVLAERYLAEFAPRVSQEVPIYLLAESQIEQLVGFNFHRGVLACGRRPQNADLESLLAAGTCCTLVICPEVHDPENLGAILRIAAVFGVDAIALGPDCCDPFSRRVLRVSMGAALRVPIAVHQDLAERLRVWQETGGLQAWAAVTDPAAADFDGLPRPARLGLVMGSEGHGLNTAWIQRCDRQVTIPMRTDFDSLNVAVAAGILLYQLAR